MWGGHVWQFMVWTEIKTIFPPSLSATEPISFFWAIKANLDPGRFETLEKPKPTWGSLLLHPGSGQGGQWGDSPSNRKSICVISISRIRPESDQSLPLSITGWLLLLIPHWGRSVWGKCQLKLRSRCWELDDRLKAWWQLSNSLQTIWGQYCNSLMIHFQQFVNSLKTISQWLDPSQLGVGEPDYLTPASQPTAGFPRSWLLLYLIFFHFVTPPQV